MGQAGRIRGGSDAPLGPPRNVVLRGEGSASILGNVSAGGTLRVLADDVLISGVSTLRSDATGDALVVAGSSSPNTTRFDNQAGGAAFDTPDAQARIAGFAAASRTR